MTGYQKVILFNRDNWSSIIWAFGALLGAMLALLAMEDPRISWSMTAPLLGVVMCSSVIIRIIGRERYCDETSEYVAWNRISFICSCATVGAIVLGLITGSTYFANMTAGVAGVCGMYTIYSIVSGLRVSHAGRV